MVYVFIYNIGLIVLYTIAMSVTFYFYLKEKKALYLILSVYLLFLILDNSIIYMTEFIADFASSYNQLFMNGPAIKTIISIVSAYCSLFLVTTLVKEKMQLSQYTLLSLLSSWFLLVPLLPHVAFKTWLYYLPTQLLMLYLGLYIWHHLKKKRNLPAEVIPYLKKAAPLYFWGGLLIFIEDSYVIFNLDHYSSLNMSVYNRNISVDIFSILSCALILKFSFFDTIQAEHKQQMQASDDDIFHAFCQHYSLTKREKEVCILLLAHKQNQEIANHIYLSVGTVKTHVHNIFIKLKIKKRNQIPIIYQEFQEKIVNGSVLLDKYQQN